MTVSAEIKEHAAGNVTFLCPIWKIEARDGTVAAYCQHTRPLTFDGEDYVVSAVESMRPLQKIGLTPNSIEVNGIFDDIITQVGLESDKWQRSRITYEIVNYLDLTMGSISKIEGFLGQWQILNEVAYQLEFLSKADALQPLLGDLTSPIDRNSFPAGIDVGVYTFAGTVMSVTNRKKFKVDYVQTSSSYFKFGLARFTSGDLDDREMEIKDSVTTDGGTRTEIELQLDMFTDISVGDTVALVAGYEGTRDQARDKFNAVIDGQFEPDLPGLKGILTYPE